MVSPFLEKSHAFFFPLLCDKFAPGSWRNTSFSGGNLPSNHKPATDFPRWIDTLQVAGQFHYLSDIEERPRPQGKAKVLNVPHQPGWAEDAYEGLIHVRQAPLEVL